MAKAKIEQARRLWHQNPLGDLSRPWDNPITFEFLTRLPSDYDGQSLPTYFQENPDGTYSGYVYAAADFQQIGLR